VLALRRSRPIQARHLDARTYLARARLAAIALVSARSPPGCSGRSACVHLSATACVPARSPCGARDRARTLHLTVRGPFSVHVRLGAHVRVLTRSPFGDRAIHVHAHQSSGTPVLLVGATHPCSPREGSRSCFMRSHLSMLAHVPRTCSPRSVHFRARLHDPPFDFSCMRGTRLCSPIFAFTPRAHLSMLTRRVRRVLQDMLAFRRSHPVPRAGSRFSRTPFDARASVLCSLKPPFDSSKPQLAVSVSTKHARLSTLTSVFAAGCPRP